MYPAERGTIVTNVIHYIPDDSTTGPEWFSAIGRDWRKSEEGYRKSSLVPPPTLVESVLGLVARLLGAPGFAPVGCVCVGVPGLEPGKCRIENLECTTTTGSPRTQNGQRDRTLFRRRTVQPWVRIKNGALPVQAASQSGHASLVRLRLLSTIVSEGWWRGVCYRCITYLHETPPPLSTPMPTQRPQNKAHILHSGATKEEE